MRVNSAFRNRERSRVTRFCGCGYAGVREHYDIAKSTDHLMAVYQTAALRSVGSSEL